MPLYPPRANTPRSSSSTTGRGPSRSRRRRPSGASRRPPCRAVAEERVEEPLDRVRRIGGVRPLLVLAVIAGPRGRSRRRAAAGRTRTRRAGTSERPDRRRAPGRSRASGAAPSGRAARLGQELRQPAVGGDDDAVRTHCAAFRSYKVRADLDGRTVLEELRPAGARVRRGPCARPSGSSEIRGEQQTASPGALGVDREAAARIASSCASQSAASASSAAIRREPVLRTCGALAAATRSCSSIVARWSAAARGAPSASAASWKRARAPRGAGRRCVQQRLRRQGRRRCPRRRAPCRAAWIAVNPSRRGRSHRRRRRLLFKGRQRQWLVPSAPQGDSPGRRQVAWSSRPGSPLTRSNAQEKTSGKRFHATIKPRSGAQGSANNARILRMGPSGTTKAARRSHPSAGRGTG